MILIIYTANTVIMATTVIIWRKSSNKKKKYKTIERPIFWDVIKVLILRDFRMRFNFITVQKILVEPKREITKGNFILIEPSSIFK